MTRPRRVGHIRLSCHDAARLPWSHGIYYKQLADRVRPTTVLYEPYAI